MTARIALLRAINVGGRGKVAMADIRSLFADLGYENVRTVLQTGNVIFDAKAGVATEAKLEKALEEQLGLKTDVMLRSAKDWDAILAANPYPDAAKASPNHLILMPLKAAPSQGTLEGLRAAIKGHETVELDSSQLYITYPDGIGRSKLTNELIEKKLGTRGTARNWNTVLKIAEAARAK